MPKLPQFSVFGNGEATYVPVASYSDLRECVPSRGETVLVTTSCVLSAWELMPVLIDPRNGHGTCLRAIITSYNMSFEAVAGLEQMLSDGAIELADVIVSEAIRRMSDGGAVYGYLDALRERFPGRVRWARRRLHAKTIGLHMKTDLCYTVVGSGNMAHNTRHEAYVILTDGGAFMHLAHWVGELMR